MSVIRAQVAGIGHYLPEKVMTNEDLAKVVDTTDEWIVQRTGIKSRHVAAEGELTSDLAIAASRKALAHAGVAPETVDLIVVATTTPDLTFPATAAKVQGALGAQGGAAFDIQAVCSGFVYALAMADNMIKLGQVKTALVIGAETFSRILDWTDRTTCVLFGDGAAALVLKAAEGVGDKTDRGILSTHLHADGRNYDMLRTSGGPSFSGQSGVILMQGQEVFKHAVRNLSDVVDEALSASHIDPAELDWFVPHQANQRIIDAVGRKLNLEPHKVVQTLSHHGNTSAASIPLALSVAVEDGRIKAGDLVLTDAMGGGFTWGAAMIRW